MSDAIFTSGILFDALFGFRPGLPAKKADLSAHVTICGLKQEQKRSTFS